MDMSKNFDVRAALFQVKQVPKQLEGMYRCRRFVWQQNFFVLQQLFSKLGQIIVEVSTSRTIKHARTHARKHTRPLTLLWTSGQVVAGAATYANHNKHNRRTSTHVAGFEPAIPATRRHEIYALDRTVTGIDQ